MKKVVILGAGPSGLTAAYELVKHGIKPLIIERDDVVGGIARTVEYKDYRFDIGGHRYFTKNKEIENIWKEVLGDDFLTRPRLSRWYYQKKFFEYPIKPFQVVRLFGLDSIEFILSYLKSRFFPIKPEKSLADWYTNQFGASLSKPFFIRYNEKLWGIPCSQLSMDFGKQRVRGVSFVGVVLNHLRSMSILEKKEIASLIDKFQYPKYGPGMMWNKFREIIEKKGGKFLMEKEVVSINQKNGKILSITIKDKKNKTKKISGDYFLSSIPLKELIKRETPKAPKEIIETAESLKFRAFVTVALIVNKRKIFPDTWIYTHDEKMKCIRIQNFNNWSSYMVPKDKNQTCLGFEYTCNFGDDFWKKSEEEIKDIAINDLVETGFAKKEDIADFKVIKLREVYPTYDLDYKNKVKKIKDYLEKFGDNLQAIGRGGMHKYNNMDHSMLTALIAARRIVGETKQTPWNVNIEAEYHEEKSN